MSETPKPDPRRVVLVDDSQEIRQVLRVLFENNGFEVVGEAESGVGVLDIVLQKKPAFVILDMRMPNIAGEETARAIRKAAPDTHIVAFSAFLEEQPEWADAFLNKDRINQIPSLLKGLVDGDATA